jgi:hypothetical protein
VLQVDAMLVRSGRPAMLPQERPVAVRKLVAGRVCSGSCLKEQHAVPPKRACTCINAHSNTDCCVSAAAAAATGTRGVEFALGAAVAEVVKFRSWNAQPSRNAQA